VAFWATVAVVTVLVLAYPLGFGPAVWMTQHGYIGSTSLSRVYRPLARAALHGPSWQMDRLVWYASLSGDVRDACWILLRWSTPEMDNIASP
jgi:hypothetical protein